MPKYSWIRISRRPAVLDHSIPLMLLRVESGSSDDLEVPDDRINCPFVRAESLAGQTRGVALDFAAGFHDVIEEDAGITRHAPPRAKSIRAAAA